MRMSQREEQIARLQAERDAYEARLPPQIRADIEFRRSRGFDVPYRPIPEAQMRVLEAAGPNATQAQIQWAYDMRNRAEEDAPPSPPSARPAAATPGRRDNPMAMPDEMGRLPVGEPAVGPEERVSGAPATEMTEEEMVARERDRIRSAIESSTDGAPAVEVYGETPASYMRDLERGTQLAAQADSQVWLDPNNAEAFGNESDLLQFREGMTDAEYEAAKANIRHRQRLLRGMGPDAGGYTAFNPQQPMYLGTAEDQEEWAAFLRDNPEAQKRYDPAAYQANKAAADKAAAQKHAAMLSEKYSPAAGAAYMRSFETGEPMDSSLVRTDFENSQIKNRKANELQARQGGARGDTARSQLQMQDEASGASGAMQNARIVPDGSGESYGSRFKKRSDSRKAEMARRRDLVAARGQLAGYATPGEVAALQMLSPDERQAVISDNLRRRGEASDESPEMARLNAQIAASAQEARLERDARAAEAEAERQLRMDLAKAESEQRDADREQARQEAEDRFQLQMQGIKDAQNAQAASLQKMRQDHELAMADLAQKRVALEQNNPGALAQSEFERNQRARDDAMRAAQREQMMAEAVGKYGVGIRDMLDEENPSFSTPAAVAALENIAADADESMAGFYPSDAGRMDAILSRLGISDPAVRQALVQKHGLGLLPTRGIGAHGGRGGLISGLYNYFNPTY